MIPSKTMVGMLAVLCAGMMLFSVQAQEGLAPMYLQKEGGEGEAKGDIDTIYTGKVIAYGELLKPPYIVELRRDTVWINGICIDPVIRTFELGPPEVEVSEMDRRKFSLDSSITTDFANFVDLYGDHRTIDMLREKYLSNTMVVDLEFHFRGKFVTAIKIIYSDGDYSLFTGYSNRHSKDSPLYYGRRGTGEDRPKLIRDSFVGIVRHLGNRYLLIFSLAGETWISGGDDQQNVLDILSRVAHGELTIEQVRAEYPKRQPFRDEYFWKEFEKKQDSWR